MGLCSVMLQLLKLLNSTTNTRQRLATKGTLGGSPRGLLAAKGSSKCVVEFNNGSNTGDLSMLQYLCLAGNVSFANVSDVWQMSDKASDDLGLVKCNSLHFLYYLIFLLDIHIHTHTYALQLLILKCNIQIIKLKSQNKLNYTYRYETF